MAMISVRDAYVRTLDQFRQGRRAQAEDGLRRLIAARPQHGALRRHLIQLLTEDGRHAEALEQARQLFQIQPEPEAEMILASQLLAAGLYAEGWPHWECRALLAAGDQRPALPTPEWKGEPVTSLVLWDEQGIGDAIQFARFALPLQRRGIDVTLVCRPVLGALFASLGVRTVTTGGTVRVPRHDAWSMLQSLPLHLAVSLDTIPFDGPYLQAPQDRRGLWRADARVGVVGRGNPRHANDLNRSLPDDAWTRLRGLTQTVSLHMGETFDVQDLADTAAIVEQLDLVITVDTSIAHLAGAMGKPCWVMLPAIGCDWRWGTTGQTTPWYPSLRLYRQPAPGDWTRVLDAIEQDLPAALG